MSLLTDVPSSTPPDGHYQHHRDLSAAVIGEVITLTPGNLTGSVVLPAGAWLLSDSGLDTTEQWDGGATLDFGDGDDGSGYLAAHDLVGEPAQPLTLMEAFNAYLWGTSYAGAYLQGGSSGYYGKWTRRYYPAGGTITATVTATDPTVGETRVLVLYVVPG